MQADLPGNAIRVLERAVNLEPLKPEYWAKLAQAHQAAEEFGPATCQHRESDQACAQFS